MPSSQSSSTGSAASTGSHAAGLIQRQHQRLEKLLPEVLRNEDPEALHQLRVSLRRLRTQLRQFAPALRLPRGVSERKLARITRVTGLSRDLDVLGERLAQDLLPLLDPAHDGLVRGLQTELRQRRRRAFRRLENVLTSEGTRTLLERLAGWLEAPDFTSLGQEPIGPWLPDWHGALVGGLFLEAGWHAQDPRDGSLHQLRKRLKGVRYGHENLEAFLGEAGLRWIQHCRSAQEVLGELHDLQVLAAVLEGQVHRRTKPRHAITPLAQALEERLGQCWGRWRSLAPTLLEPGRRRELQGLFLTPPPHTPSPEAIAP
ncbi:MAG: CHAD domain-containing protein [Synechococcus sp.]